MFQYEYFSFPDYLKHRAHCPAPKQGLPACFTKPEELTWIRSSYWAEHCLECGEPLCYETCPNYSPRADGRCKLFYYGMHDAPHFDDAFYHVGIRFRKWAKLETIVCDGVYSPDRARRVHDDWKQRSKKKALLMHLGPIGMKRFPLKDRRKFDSAKYKFSQKDAADNLRDTPAFLLQLYSYEQSPFTLFFDITDDTDLAFRKGITIHPGYNQHCFDVHSLFPPKGRLRAKFYPADNGEVSVTFLFCEFVQLKDGVQPETYPAAPVTATPPADKVKCVAWDLDNTVWDGILIESDPLSLTMREGVLDTIKALDDRGIIQIVVSKNNEEQVLPVLKCLGIDDYFVYVFANWDAKSANLKLGAELLNIGINTFALIDDSVFERGEVGHALPMVRTYDETVVHPNTAHSILSRPELDVPVTADSRGRRKMYQTEAQRTVASRSAGGDALDFLRSCKLTARLSRPETPEELLRSYELLQRTNQLNLSGSKYEQQAFYDHVSGTPRDCFILKCEDRFGSYGQVAYFEAEQDKETGTLAIVEFAMSCRVAGKYVESALMEALFRRYEGVSAIELRGRKTDRNGLLMQTFLSAGFTDRSTDTDIRLVCGRDTQRKHTDIVQISDRA